MQASEVFENCFLVGGTALALQLGHRESYDIDLFTLQNINKDEILNFFNKKYNGGCQIINNQNIIFQLMANGIKIDFVKYDYNLIEDVKIEDGIKYLDKKDISAMKLMAIANRGDQAKNFVDIYYLLKEIPLADMFEYFKQKYKQNDISIAKKSLIYFDDVSNGNWKAVKFLQDKLSAIEIKQKIQDEVKKYNDKISKSQVAADLSSQLKFQN